MAVTIQIDEAVIDAGARLKIFARAHPEAGGIVTFTGQVRGASEADPVRALYLQAHPKMTVTGIEAAVEATQSRFDVAGVDVVHRVGLIAAGETIVFVSAAARHRRDAFHAADFLMDYLKTKAVFWKREDRDSGSRWIEPRDQDFGDAKRWEAACSA